MELCFVSQAHVACLSSPWLNQREGQQTLHGACLLDASRCRQYCVPATGAGPHRSYDKLYIVAEMLLLAPHHAAEVQPPRAAPSLEQLVPLETRCAQWKPSHPCSITTGYAMVRHWQPQRQSKAMHSDLQ